MFALLMALAAPLASPPEPAAARVAFDRHHIVSRQARGLADRATTRRVTVADPVRVASVSKLAVALGVMRLVDQHRLDLDRDVSAYLGWRLANPAFPDRPITLRTLLSHTAGVRDGVDYALALDDDLPTVMARHAAWDTGHAPGAYFTYANLNFPVIAAVMEGATGERFDRLMARLVFAPLHLNACFNWTTCRDSTLRHAVVLYRADGSVARDDLHGQRPPCPGTPAHGGSCDLSRYRLARNGAFFSPQGGVRIGMTDLARLGAVLDGQRPDFLSRDALSAMTTPVWRFDGSNGDSEHGFYCAYGLGVTILALPGRPAPCRDDPFGDGRVRIGHAGEAYGLRSGLWVDPATGKGLAYFVSAVPDNAAKGTRSAFTAAEEAAIDGR
ncbi:serine hydrolase domain-containing protein [Sphingomonas sp. GlSt437]|uniref:serine hydrolase domain-containing protein n=2 Tax=Pseudomonadota TaxID=1224 RepID=UPI003A8B76A6